MTELEKLVEKRKANEKKAEKLCDSLREWYHWTTSVELDQLNDQWNELSQKIKILKGSKNG
jgi:hypothetical protein